MNTYLIAYDLYRPGQDYSELIAAIKTYNGWCHAQLSVWAIRSNKDALAIHRHLGVYLDSNDKLLVTQIGPNTAWNGATLEVSNWLKNNLVA